MTLDTLRDIPKRCRSCVFWELSPQCSAAMKPADDHWLDKEAWVSSTLLEWGSCGRIVYVGDKPAGYVTYAAPHYVPRAAQFPTGPASADAALLMTTHVEAAYTGMGLGRLLVQAASADLAKRGIRAIETFGDTRGETEACMAPANFFLAVGFKTVSPDPYYPRLRLDITDVHGESASAGAIDIAVEEWLRSITEGVTIASMSINR